MTPARIVGFTSLGLCFAYTLVAALLNAQFRIVIAVCGALYLLSLIMLTTLLLHSEHNQKSLHSMIMLALVTVSCGTFLIGRMINGECQSYDQWHMYGCSSEASAHSLPQEHIFTILVLPVLSAAFFRSLNTAAIVVQWLVCVGFVAAAICISGAVQSVPCLVLGSILSALIVSEIHISKRVVSGRSAPDKQTEDSVATGTAEQPMPQAEGDNTAPLTSQQQQQEEANSEMRHMIANVAHDLKTPLSAFMNGVEMIGDQIRHIEELPKVDSDASAGPRGEHLSTIRGMLTNLHSTNAFMTMTINRCIDYTKASKGMQLEARPETVNLAEVIALPLNCMKDLQTRIAIALAPIPSSVAAHIITDKQWLQENLFCLISNAVKYSSNGSVTISVSLTSNANPLISAFRDKALAEALSPRSTSYSVSQQQQQQQQQRRKSSTPGGGDRSYMSASNSVSSPTAAGAGATDRNAHLDKLVAADEMAGGTSSRESTYRETHQPAAERRHQPLSNSFSVRSEDTIDLEAGAAVGVMGTSSYSSRSVSTHIARVASGTIKVKSAGANSGNGMGVKRTSSLERFMGSGSGSSSNSRRIHPTPSLSAASFESFSNITETRLHAHDSSSTPTPSPTSRGALFIESTSLEGIAEKSSSSEERSPGQDLLLLEVEDTGIGLSEEVMRGLFAPFKQAQRRAGGTGLGLYSLAKRVQALDGCYGVRHRRDGQQGSVFWFAIPYKPDSAAMTRNSSSDVSGMMVASISGSPQQEPNGAIDVDSPPPVSSSGGALNSLTISIPPPEVQPVRTRVTATASRKLSILVADDAIPILKMTSMMLRRQGHTVTTAENGEDALRRLADRKTELAEEGDFQSCAFDVVLMDLNMPVMDGLEATTRLRAIEIKEAAATGAATSCGGVVKSRHQFVVGFSANSDHATMLEAYDAGVDDFICKPFALQTFYDTYNKHSGRSPVQSR